MNAIFKHTSSYWVRYTEYVWKDKKGVLYLTPAPEAEIKLYDPLKGNNADEMVIDAVKVGMAVITGKDREAQKHKILEFITKYGLLGFMTALPTTPKFMDYEAVYLPLNPFLKAETKQTAEYVDMFFPFKKPDFYKDGKTLRWHVADDREMNALLLTLGYNPEAVNMGFLRDYAERFDWLLQQFRQWAFELMSVYFYYNDFTDSDEDRYDRGLIQKSIQAFECVAPTYRVVLDRKPAIVWDFHSLSLIIRIMLNFLMTDEANPLRLCRFCTKPFISQGSDEVFCSEGCERGFEEKGNR